VKLLIDAHTLIWAADAPARLSATAMSALADPANDRFVSATTVWEIAIKVGLGKLALSQAFRPWVDKALLDLQAAFLPIAVAHAEIVVSLPLHHGDPLDRMLAAQATAEEIAIVSADGQLDAHGITRIW
jgi:PIN domain nuclease of toxin-antitoxin system